MSGKEQLQALRGRLDEIDARLMPLFQERMRVVEQVAEVKRENNLSILDQGREQQIIDKVAATADKACRAEASLLMRTILALSKGRQRKALFPREVELLPPPRAALEGPLTCAYQGVTGAWGEQALVQVFPEAEKLAEEHFEDVFRAVKDGRAHYGVVPIENSLTGAIGETYDLLRKYGCYIVGRTQVEIKQCLLAHPGVALGDVKRVYSHPQALSQCQRYLHRKGWEQTACRNTAVAAKLVADLDDPGAAAVGSRYAAQCYGLEVLEPDIMDSTGNRTSFIILADQPEYDERSDMMTVTFSTAHRSGALCETLMPFMAHGINLARIESRPAPGGNYRFFADLEGSLLGDAVQGALYQAGAASEYFEVLGCYRIV